MKSSRWAEWREGKTAAHGDDSRAAAPPISSRGHAIFSVRGRSASKGLEPTVPVFAIAKRLSDA